MSGKSRGDPYSLTAQDRQVFVCRKTKEMSISKTAKHLGVSTTTIKRVQNKPAYNQLLIDELSDQGMGVAAIAEGLIKATQAERSQIIGTTRRVEADEVVRLNAIKEIISVFGASAPKEQIHKHELAMTSDSDLILRIQESCETYGIAKKNESGKITTNENEFGESGGESDSSEALIATAIDKDPISVEGEGMDQMAQQPGNSERDTIP